MRLNIDETQIINDVSEDQLRRLLPTIAIDQFAILGRGDEQYIQFYRADDGYQVEYRDGSYDEHFELTGDISIEAIVAAFVAYHAGNQAEWKDCHSWSKIDFDEDFGGDDELTHYELGGIEYARICVGKEREPTAGVDGQCPECDREFGDLHESGCTCEECPCCHESLMDCPCE